MRLGPALKLWITNAGSNLSPKVQQNILHSVQKVAPSGLKIIIFCKQMLTFIVNILFKSFDVKGHSKK